MEFQGEALRSTLIYSQSEEVWERVKLFNAINNWMALWLQTCLIENSPCGPTDIGCIRRLVFLESQQMIREKLVAYYASEKRKAYTYEVLPPMTEDDEKRSPFSCKFSDMRVTLSISEVCFQEKTYVEFYSTFKCDSKEDINILQDSLVSLFDLQLHSIQRSISRYVVDVSLPSVLINMRSNSRFTDYHDDIEKLEYLWKDSKIHAAAVETRNEQLKSELKSTQAVLQATVASEANFRSERCGRIRSNSALSEDPRLVLSEEEASITSDSELEQDIKPNEVPQYLPDTIAMRRAPGLCLSAKEIEAIFKNLDESNKGYLTREQLIKYYLQIDIFETPATINRVVDKYLRNGKINIDLFHSLMLNRVQQ